MVRSRSERVTTRRRPAGFTLAEMLVALALGSIVLLAIGSGFVFVTQGWQSSDARLATQESLRVAVETLTREVRLASACQLATDVQPPTNFQPLSGVHSGTTDTIVVRSNTSCVQGTLSAACNACGQGPLQVGSVSGFVNNMWAYIYEPNSVTLGQAILIDTVNSSNNTLAIDSSTPIASGNYTADSTNGFATVYGLDQRTFTISTINGIPTLTIQTLINPVATPLVKGIEELSVQYVLNRTYNSTNCPAGQTSTGLCIVSLPASASDWMLVRAIQFTVSARSLSTVTPTPPACLTCSAPDGYLHLSEVFQVTPRNFVFPQGRL